MNDYNSTIVITPWIFNNDNQALKKYHDICCRYCLEHKFSPITLFVEPDTPVTEFLSIHKDSMQKIEQVMLFLDLGIPEEYDTLLQKIPELYNQFPEGNPDRNHCKLLFKTLKPEICPELHLQLNSIPGITVYYQSESGGSIYLKD